MNPGKLSFYLDESLPTEIGAQLRRRGISAVTVRDLSRLGDDDLTHLKRAASMGMVLCSNDADFLELALNPETEHAGIVVGRPSMHSIGDWVEWLALMHEILTPDDMINHLEYVKK